MPKQVVGSPGRFTTLLQSKRATFSAEYRLYRCLKQVEVEWESEEVMFAVRKMLQPELRERVSVLIVEMLNHLPEKQKNAFIWKHYLGWGEDQIASNLKCSRAEVESMLYQLNSTLFREAGAILA
ncbi:MAG: sigma-70 region 4 domain-containing protein [Acidobacteriota bacterium]